MLLQQHLPFTVLKPTNTISFVVILVATALTVYGIETFFHPLLCYFKTIKLLQQHLPFTVLKPIEIEIKCSQLFTLQQHLPFTVLKQSPELLTFLVAAKVATALTVYGIETGAFAFSLALLYYVATALTVYGIETVNIIFTSHMLNTRLQQHLPFTVLKLMLSNVFIKVMLMQLQQHLPFTVLKLVAWSILIIGYFMSCNSTYRLRY